MDQEERIDRVGLPQSYTSGCVFCGHVGISVLENNVESVQYHLIKSRNRSKNIGNTTYNLGNESSKSNPEEAIQAFLQREFEVVLKREKTAHDVIFIPDSFLFKGLTEKAVVKKEGRKAVLREKEKLEKLKKYDSNLRGDQEEEKLFESLRRFFISQNTKNTVVISGWKDVGQDGKEKGEFDFLIICEPTNTIYQVEVKDTYKGKNKKTAAEQLEHGKKLLEEKIPFFIEENWKHVKIMCFGDGLSGDKVCQQCQPFVFQTGSDMRDKFSRIFQNTSKPSSQQQTYENILKYLLHQMFQQKECITQTDLIKYTEDKSHAIYSKEGNCSVPEKIFFWSRVQLSLIKTTAHNTRMAFTSSFGTGKTILLKAKATELLKKGEKVSIIIYEAALSLLTMEYQFIFRGSSASIQIISNCSGDLAEQLEKIFSDKNSHFFIDELPVGDFGIHPSSLNLLAKKMPKNKYIWLACQSHRAPDPEELTEFVVPDLSHPFRYAANPLLTCEANRNVTEGTSWPSKEVNPRVYLNKGIRTRFLALKPNTSLVFAVEQLVYILDRERVKTIIKIEFDEHQVIPKLKQSVLQNRLIFEDSSQLKLKEFQTHSDKILVVTSNGNDFIKGCEVPMLVLFASFIEGPHNTYVFSRCMSSLIVVCNEEHVDKLISKACSFAYKIPIHDTLMPESFSQLITSNEYIKVKKELLSERPIPFDIRNEASQSGLMIACKNNVAKTAKVFIELGSDMNSIDSEGMSPVHFAAQAGVNFTNQMMQSTKEHDQRDTV